MEYRLGDIVQLKKPHACGANEWMILRTGVDFKLECNQCKKQVWLKRIEFNKRVRKIKQEDKYVSIQNFERIEE